MLLSWKGPLPPSHVKKFRLEAMLQRTKKTEQVCSYVLRTCVNEAISLQATEVPAPGRQEDVCLLRWWT